MEENIVLVPGNRSKPGSDVKVPKAAKGKYTRPKENS